MKDLEGMEGKEGLSTTICVPTPFSSTRSCPIMELPQAIRCAPRSFDHWSQPRPGDVGITWKPACEGGKAVVADGDDLFAPNETEMSVFADDSLFF
jgi:hypothetical protein